ncbi:dihydrolipoyl dehydrogenase [Comamonas endophytica]|uniref:Dihydrolipoyl dehydrogenase n=1 Tax=Comamonas endophytica TaxID=2949090 RepID=A0ABY6GAL3_9BURK|nr:MULTISPECIES: dihydrolipoyl dehydrogenase [unclassified Acidovorax]MCD2511806.1 dihydrolipoyl dehydrogenase [Acidovorax sp. D4N7]UYG51529.1 dihydrolipoyl dehydrogenase [Acidovorax sp. 5MLIR]
MQEPHSFDYDVLIIGAGSAGLSALRAVRRHTERFALIDAGPWGTTCARVGCMPSKLLLEAAHAFNRRHQFEAFGLRGAQQLHADIPAVLQRVRDERNAFVAGVLESTEDLGPRAITGRARIVDPHTVEIDGERRLSARSLVIATGSKPHVPEEWRVLGKRVLTTDTLFEQADLPRRMAVLGLGPLGTEMAQALAQLGIEVTAFHAGEHVAGLADPQVNAALQQTLRASMQLQLGHRPSLGAVQDDGITIHAGDFCTQVDAVLAATGRRPVVDGLGLENLGLPLDRHGLPELDRHTLQLGELSVFWAGDVNPDRALLHEAADEGEIAGSNAVAAQPQAYARRTPLAITFTEPSVATIGLPYDPQWTDEVAIGGVDFARQGRARMGLRNQGMLRLYARAQGGELLGAQLCAPAGEHLAHLLAWAIGRKCSVADLLELPFYHPVIEEGLRTALRDLQKHVHAPPAPGGLRFCAQPGLGGLD